MNEEVKSPINTSPQEFKKLLAEKDPKTLAHLEQFSKAAVAGDMRAQAVIDELEKRPTLKFESHYDQNGTLALNPYLTNELRDLLNDGHKLEFDKITTVEGAVAILNDELIVQRSAAGSLRELLTRVKEEKKANIQARLDTQKVRIKILAQMKHRLKKLLMNKSE